MQKLLAASLPNPFNDGVFCAGSSMTVGAHSCMLVHAHTQGTKLQPSIVNCRLPETFG